MSNPIIDWKFLGGIRDQLCLMWQEGKTLTPIQMDFYAISTFNGDFICDGLQGFLTNPDGHLIFVLPECMARQNLPKSAEILALTRALFPVEKCRRGSKAMYPQFPLFTEQDKYKLVLFDAQLSALVKSGKETYGQAVQRIATAHKDELPDPAPTDSRMDDRNRRGPRENPFTGDLA